MPIFSKFQLLSVNNSLYLEKFYILTIIYFSFWHKVQQTWVSESEAKTDPSKDLSTVSVIGTGHDA
jgi:hypothetical protein